MIRNAFYTTYCSKEYRINRYFVDEKVVCELLSYDIEDLIKGFYQHRADLYIKAIQEKDVGNVYWVRTFVAYKGRKFRVDREEGNLICFGTDDEILAKELDFKRLDRGFCLKWIDKSEVAIFEEKELQPNFFKTNPE